MELTGGELVQDFLATFEIPYVFGKPGTTETTFLAAVAASKATYVLAVHESSAVGIAAGYALITGKPAVVSLHTYPGLANGMFNMRNALMSGIALLVINSQQDSLPDSQPGARRAALLAARRWARLGHAAERGTWPGHRPARRVLRRRRRQPVLHP